jgi:hypothetical protein
MLRWRVNLAEILKDPSVEAAILARIRAHDPNPQSWVVLDALQRYFSPKNEGCESNFFVFSDATKLKISQEGIVWVTEHLDIPYLVDESSYSTWYIAQRVGKARWLKTFLSPFPEDDSLEGENDE